MVSMVSKIFIVDYLHVFSWSARPGTPAATLAQRVPEREIGRRSACLRAFSEERRRAQRRRLSGRQVEVVVLETGGSPPRARALTGNYVELALPPLDAPRGSLIRVRAPAAT